MKNFTRIFVLFFVVAFSSSLAAQETYSVKDHYNKAEYRIPMRDGVKLFTAVYTPKDTTKNYPILIWRTPYSCWPYGKDKFRQLPVELAKDGFIFVYQDVRGRFMSEGKFVNMRPYIPNKKGKQTDESSDAWDTEDWLIKHIKHNNGKIGIFGISYPGFYAAMACIDAHPALKAASPQAPIANWWVDDDMHHHGVLSMQMTLNFFSVFGIKRDSLISHWPHPMPRISPDAYNYFMSLEPLPNVDKKFYHGKIAFWEQIKKHPNYDKFWKKRNTLPHFHHVTPAVLTVGGWYDSEDFYGTLHTYHSIEAKNPGAQNMLIIGPWPHGWWASTKGYRLGDITYGSATAEYFRKEIQLPFFRYYLKGKGHFPLTEARMFNTGVNRWRSFDQWPPKDVQKAALSLESGHQLTFGQPKSAKVNHYSYVSDPHKPVPYTAHIMDSRAFYYHPYMNEDQRFAARRPDVLVFETAPLEKDVTLAGPLLADLYVSTTGTDADWVVKLIDVFPDSARDPNPNPTKMKAGGYQMLIRGDILRGKYRNNPEKPEPFTPGKITEIKLPLQDVLHTFKKGHRIMIQIQSSWFPFFDVNPQTFTNIYKAKPGDFVKATQSVWFSKEYPSKIVVGILP
ncbi:CocE/NonD family hydrolase [Candidatus Sulfidibacterium hydrothermale]|uniref:CocE/NonD family hydrolase n=1 Tax=Candidatus Sulfidibacterium hydrothermale TaxID=2875962 RepID=UPI001F0A885C|nr:CocE/NonD family hydrolase [Candidatus Sulfidibacterium hydrothermale]UBM62686.1 CocE/NonD family hydrolase [Candidatus Sulfidibacterium hydrothermale]